VLPDSSTGLDYILQKAIGLMDGLVVYPERMLENLKATKGLIFSGQLLLALTNKGLSRETAYDLVQRNAMRVWDEDRDFHELVKADDDIKAQMSGEEIDRVFSLEHYLRNIDSIYRRVFVS
jgi:adenylosuccinate lyase